MLCSEEGGERSKFRLPLLRDHQPHNRLALPRFGGETKDKTRRRTHGLRWAPLAPKVFLVILVQNLRFVNEFYLAAHLI